MQKISFLGFRRFTTASLAGIAITLSLSGNAANGNSGASEFDSIGPAGALGNVSSLRSNYIAQHRGAKISESGGAARVYGTKLAEGVTAKASAMTAVHNTAALFGAVAEDLQPGADHLKAGENTLPLRYDRTTGEYRFTAVYFNQVRDGVPVFGARATALVSNMPGFPTVSVNPDVRDLGNFRVNPVNAIAAPSNAGMRTALKQVGGKGAQIASSRRVIFAGTAGNPYPATLADEQEVHSGVEMWRIVTDAKTGAVLYTEDLICFGTVTGNVSGLATDGPGTANCEPEVSKPLPYAQINTGLETVFTNVNGNFTTNNFGGTLTALLEGLWFDVDNNAGANATATVAASTPANFLFNGASSEQVQAQINAYREANVVRDFVLQFHPTYPSLSVGNFPVIVNRTDGFCPQNAWYSPGNPTGTLSFCLSNGSAPNTSWGSVVYHEYGHHLVNVAGSGQGQYGEGAGDVMSVLILDDPCLGLGFFGNCSQCLRDGDNTMQYPCATDGHACAPLLSGCIWSIRNYLIVTNPGDYIDILADLFVNSMPLHSGSTITPQICIDFLTLDDDNGNLSDGTPHAPQIAQGFDDHNMLPAEFQDISFSFPNGLPTHISPIGTTTVLFAVTNLIGNAQPGTGEMFVNTGGGYVQASVIQTSPNNYEATFPSSTCGDVVDYYFQADSQGGATVTSPFNAPSSNYSTLSAFDVSVAFDDDFQTNQGWTVATTATDGGWTRGVPVDYNRGDPPTDADGSGQCYVTDNDPGNSNSDVDSGSTILTSPVMDASGGGFAVGYWRWLSNATGDNPGTDPLTVEISSNNGASWQVLEIVGPAGPGTTGGWIRADFSLDDVPGFVQNNQFRIRFTAEDIGATTQSIVEAGIDGVELIQLDCTPPVPTCPANLDSGDSVVDVFDLFILLSNWGTNGAGADLADDTNIVDVFDLFVLLSAWGNCP